MSAWLLALFDDVAMLMDDAAIATKISMKKTAWILWDDLAVNAEKATGFCASRELPVLWRITKWAFINKIIILPIAFLLSYFLPILIVPLLLLGWIYLAYEWAEKVVEKLFNYSHEIKAENEKVSEDEKVKSAVLTDFILSVEIIIIALSTVKDQTFLMQTIVVSIVAIAAVVFVYWLVAFLVRLDDMWAYLIKKSNNKWFWAWFWNLLIISLPKIVRLLGIIWTIAMFLVAGWIFSHNIEFLHHFYEDYLNFLYPIIFDLILWFIIWLISVFLMKIFIKFKLGFLK